MFSPEVAGYLAEWNLIPDGEPFQTPSSQLIPVVFEGQAAVLKIAEVLEERAGGLLMQWWAGRGAAQVYRADACAVLLERAQGSRSLIRMSEIGQDGLATEILCKAAGTLHSLPGRPDGLTSLPVWFEALEPGARRYGGILTSAARVAGQLVDAPQDERVLHGDIHHGNVLDFGDGGWKAIDPKGLWGERGFDYANIFNNPNQGCALRHFEERLDVVVEISGIERRRLLKWILAYSGLSAVWFMDDGQMENAAFPLAVAEKAANFLS